MLELITRLKTQRAELVATMTRAIAAEEDWHCWIALLAQIETAIQAVEAVMEERGWPARTHDNVSSRATENGPISPPE